MLPRDQMPQYAESIPDGPTSRRWAGLAKELGVWLLGGSMIEPVEGQPGKLYNTAVLFSDSGTPRLHSHSLETSRAGTITKGLLSSTCCVRFREGDLAARYRKIHLFDVCVPGVVDFQESALISSGKEVRRAHTTLACA